MNRKTNVAVALEYAEGAEAPVVTAVGKGKVADAIVRTAKEHEIPLYEDPELANNLQLLGLGEQIPPELYAVVAQILIFVCDIDRLAVR